MGSKKREIRAETATESSERADGYLGELSRIIKGWRHLASDVRVDGDHVALLLGESEGRLVFVHHIVGSKDEVTRGALMSISRAELDARRLGAQFSVGEEIAPLVVVVTEGKTQGVLRQLSALCPEPLLLLAERRLTTAEGNMRFLEVLTPQIEVQVTPLESAARAVSSTSQLSQELERVVARVDRIDPDLQRDRFEDEVRWSWFGEPLCSVELGTGSELQGRIGADGVPHDITESRSMEVFLDWVLARHLELIETVEGDSLKDVELMPHSSEPLLTPEEIAAFQE